MVGPAFELGGVFWQAERRRRRMGKMYFMGKGLEVFTNLFGCDN
jgi:hypothetical protein